MLYHKSKDENLVEIREYQQKNFVMLGVLWLYGVGCLSESVKKENS